MSGRSRSRIADGFLEAGYIARMSRTDPTTAGMRAARGWLHARGLPATTLVRWYVEVLLDIADRRARAEFDERTDTRFRLEIYSEEWGFLFCHARRASRIRVTHTAFVHGRDDFGLLATTPPLKDIGVLLRSVERHNAIQFRRQNALIRTNLPNAEAGIRRWVEWL